MNGHFYTNKLTRDNIHIPALGMSYASLSALQSFFQSSTIVAEWVAGAHSNTNLGVAAAALSGDVDIADRFTKMTTAMTTYLRYGPNSQAAYREVIQSESYISVRWGYFVIPISTEGFAILFAISRIFRNRRSCNVPLWKSSALAVLLYQHHQQLGILESTGKDIHEIHNETEEIKVRLQ